MVNIGVIVYYKNDKQRQWACLHDQRRNCVDLLDEKPGLEPHAKNYESKNKIATKKIS